MDALEFLKERKRMCNSYKNCDGCLLERGNCGLSTNTSNEECERIITAVEKWSKEHPRKTRQSEFLKQWPEASIDESGVLEVCPMELSATYRDSDGDCNNTEKLCVDCRHEFWMREVE